jgi:thiamine-monophosphate kinase
MSTERRRIQIILDLMKRYPCVPAEGFGPTIGVEHLDDCAVIPISPDTDLVVGTDFVRGEGFHLFKCGILSHYDIGYYLVAANASDLAAMGALPLGIVVAFRYRSDMTDAEFEQTMEGVLRACADFSLPLLGGDTGGYQCSVLSAAAFGTCPRGRALLRAGGTPGDRLFLTGSVGMAGAALAYFMRGRTTGIKLSSDVEELLANSWRRVRPALAQARCLVDLELSRCAIDTSDGLKAAARQLAEASNLDAVLITDQIPIEPHVSVVAEALRVDTLALAVGDSVDFRVLFAVSQSHVARTRDVFNECGWDLFEIGYLEPARGIPGVHLQGSNGDRIPLPGIEWSQEEILSIDALRAQDSQSE